MRTPTARDLLQAWDDGRRASSAERAMLLVKTVRDESAAALSAMPLGWVSARLLELRAALIGPRLTAIVNCHACDAVIETGLDVRELTSLSPSDSAADPPAPIEVNDGGYRLFVRLPACRDLVSLRVSSSEAAGCLARALVSRAERSGTAVAAGELPHTAHAAIERAVLDHDPLAHVELALACPQCGTQWAEPLHVFEFVWIEVSAHVERLFGEVARLAWAFGWSEADILSLSDARRVRYLELLRS